MADKPCILMTPSMLGTPLALPFPPDIFISDQAPAPPTRRPLNVPVWTRPEGIFDFPLTEPRVLYFLATMTRATYYNTASFFQDAAQAVLPVSYPITFVANGPGQIPGYAIVNLPSCAIICISGTTNLQQWMDQIFLSTLFPTNFGTNDNARVLSSYLNAALVIDTALTAAVGATKPVIYCGHSMGGAVATVLYYKARFGQRPSTNCLTFGSPKPGNGQLSGNIDVDLPRYRRLFCPGDFVPSLPPFSYGILRAFIENSALPGAGQWDSYRPAGSLYSVGQDGTITGADQPWLPSVLLSAALQATLGQPIPIVAPHNMGTMTANLRQSFVSFYTYQREHGWVSPDYLDDVNAAMTRAGIN